MLSAIHVLIKLFVCLSKEIHAIMFKSPKRWIYIEKHHLLPYPKANLAFMRKITHSTPSVFHANQLGMPWLFIQTLGRSSGAILNPMGNPNISTARDWFQRIFHIRDIVWHSKISRLKFCLTPSRHLGGALGPHPQPHGAPQHQQGQGWILENIS